MKRFFSFVLLLLSLNGYLKGQVDGSLDMSFNLGTGADWVVNSFSIQSDGKIIIGGEFSFYNGIARKRIARLNSDGTLDTSFNPGTGANGSVWSTSIQADGKIIIGGDFTSYNGTSRYRIARLNSDGTLDTSFNQGTGASSTVSSTSIQDDGKIIISGWFTNYNGTVRDRIARLNTNGTLDTSFNPGTGANYTIRSTSIQADGKIIIGGQFTTFNGTARNRIARLNTDGTLDTSFDPGSGASSDIETITIQVDGKIIIGGDFTSYNATSRNYISRLNNDGTLDTGFNPGIGASGTVYSASIQSDGKIIIGGAFTTYNGTTRNSIARLYNDGSLDTSFDPGSGADNIVYSTSILADERIIIGGLFTSFNGIARYYLARISAIDYQVQGSLFNDFNASCIKDSLEFNISGTQNLIIQPGNTITQANNGYWQIDSLPIGTYTATVDTSGPWKASCSPTVSFTVVHPDSFVQVTPIGMKNINPCTEPEISIYAPILRRCFNQNIFVEASNHSTASQVMYNAYADITLDPFLTVNSASKPYTALGNNVYRFQLDSLYPGQSKTWTISTTVSCSTTIGQTLCMDAKIFPVASCVLDSTPNPVVGVSPCLGPWDKSSLGVEGTCVGDSIRFVIENHGVFGNGDMDCYMPIRIYANGVLISLDSLKIVGGDSLVIMIPADGRTWRLEADQHPLHPGNSHPNATVDACGNASQLAQNWTPGTVNTMPLDDADPVIDIYCGVVSGSFDPNDKTGYPTGVTNNHYILKNQQLQYVIRFQNTGTDTAFTVVIRDTLDTDLDIFSVKSGVSSHNYSFRMYGPRVLEWTFNNIMLPDSFHSEPNSHGFVTFTVEQVENLPDGTLIENSAAIYFDFNDPIITNKSQHTITETWPLITTVSDLNNIQHSDIQVYPNPTEDKLHVLSSLPSTIKLLDLTGRLLKNMPAKQKSHELNLTEYPAGIYLLEVEVNGKIEVKKIIRP